MKTKILLGFEVGTGKPVHVPLHHLIVCGMTQLSGKTTTLEALLSRSKLTALTFRTKRGELGFETANRVSLYMNQTGLIHWRALEGVLSAALEEKVQREPYVRGKIIQLCSGAKSLDEVYQRVLNNLGDPRQRKWEDVYTKIQAYLDIVLPQLQSLHFTAELELKPGLNMMDLEGLSDEMQNLIIYASIEWIHQRARDTILVMPEAWKFIPQDRGSPCKVAVEKFSREGAVIGNYLWIDSQDLRGVDKKYLRQIDNWILGRQRAPLEIEMMLDSIPLEPRLKPRPEEIMQLKIGHFIACLHDEVKRVYVQPAWLSEEEAKQVAVSKSEPPSPQPILEAAVSKLPPDVNAAFAKLTSILRHLTIGYEDLRSRLAKVETRPEPLMMPATGPTVGLDLRETVFKIHHGTDVEVKLSTSGGLGRIMYVMLNDLGSAASSEKLIGQALSERGWPTGHSTLAPNLAQLVRRGFLIKDGSPATYRPPGKTRILVVKEP